MNHATEVEFTRMNAHEKCAHLAELLRDWETSGFVPSYTAELWMKRCRRAARELGDTTAEQLMASMRETYAHMSNTSFIEDSLAQGASR